MSKLSYDRAIRCPFCGVSVHPLAEPTSGAARVLCDSCHRMFLLFVKKRFGGVRVFATRIL